MQHRPRKRFGQNFLHDRGVIARIVAAIDPQPSDRVLEIGPGRGALTRLLVGRCALTVIEIDRELAAALRGDPVFAEVRVIEGDVLEARLEDLGADLRLVGNLPYNVSSPVLFWALSQRHRVRDMHFMLQREVVQRMAAAPGSKTYGRLSVMVQYACRVEPLFRVPPGAFHPVPRVESAVLRLVPRPWDDAPLDEARLAGIVRAAFAQRRKTLGNALAGLADRDALVEAGVDPRARAEQLGIADFVRLARRLPRAPGDRS